MNYALTAEDLPCLQIISRLGLASTSVPMSQDILENLLASSGMLQMYKKQDVLRRTPAQCFPWTIQLNNMKGFGIATLIALSALINGSSAAWCACYQNGGGFLGKDIVNTANTDGCCLSTTGKSVQGGSSFFGLTAKGWCDASSAKADEFKKCCTVDYGYCK